MDLFKLAQQSGDLLDAIDNALWDASIAQDHERYERLQRLWDLAHKRHSRRSDEYKKICKQSAIE